MSEKGFLLGLILGFAFYSIEITYLCLLSAKRPVPSNLSDLWPAEESEKKQIGKIVRYAFLFRSLVVISITLSGLVLFDVPVFLCSILPYHPLIRSLAAVVVMILFLLSLGWVVRHLWKR